MPRASIIQTNFTSGEVSPTLKGRVDIARYANGVEQLLNFVVRPQGGAFRRTGTKFVNQVKDSSKKTIIQEFIFSNVQAYILEFGDSYMRIYKDGGIVESPPGTPVEVVTPWGEDDLVDLSFSQSADVLYVCHPLFQTRVISRTSHTSWSIGLFVTEDGPYLPVNSTDVILTLSSIVDAATMTASAATFAAGDVGKFVEYRENDVWKLAKITAFTSSTVVTVDVVDEVKTVSNTTKLTYHLGTPAYITSDHSGIFQIDDDGKYVRIFFATGFIWAKLNTNGYSDDATYYAAAVTQVTYTFPTVTMAVTGRSITATLTASASTFASTDVGRLFRLNYGGHQVWGTITGFTLATSVGVSLTNTPPLDSNNPTLIYNNGSTDLWRLGAWSDTTGWPAIVTFHEQRITFARTNTEPQTVWMSVSGDYPNFAPSDLDSLVKDDSAITYTIVSGDVNPVMWMISKAVLLVGTTSAEWQVKASTINQPLTPVNTIIVPQTGFGSRQGIVPKHVASAIMFVQRGGRKVREMTYSFAEDSFIARDMNTISEHILRKNDSYAVDLSYQREPHSIVWICTSDGRLVGMTYEKDQEVVAWHDHKIGGSAVVESLACIPEGNIDTLYMVVNRGGTIRTIEYLTPDFEPPNVNDASTIFIDPSINYLDGSISYSGAPTTVLTGLDHLESQTVSVMDGSTLTDVGPRVVSGGQITLVDPVTIALVGVKTVAKLKTLPPEGGSNDGSSQGKLKRISKVTLRLLNSYGYKHSGNGSAYMTVPPNADSSLTSKDDSFNLDDNYESEGTFYILKDDIYPLNILMIAATISSNDRQ